MISRPSVASKGSHTPRSPPFRIEIGTKDRKIKKFLSKKYRNNPQPRSNVLLSNSDILYSKFSHFFHTFSSEHFEQFNKEALYRASQNKQKGQKNSKARKDLNLYFQKFKKMNSKNPHKR